MGCGYVWLDTETHDSLLKNGQFIETLKKRRGLKATCPKEIDLRIVWIAEEQLKRLAADVAKSG